MNENAVCKHCHKIIATVPKHYCARSPNQMHEPLELQEVKTVEEMRLLYMQAKVVETLAKDELEQAHRRVRELDSKLREAMTNRQRIASKLPDNDR